MGKYRPSVRGVLELLWYMNERSDPDFYLTTYPKKLKPGTHSKMLQELDSRPAMGIPDMRDHFAKNHREVSRQTWQEGCIFDLDFSSN